MEIFIAYWKFKNKIHLFEKVTDKKPLCNTNHYTSITGDAMLSEFLKQVDSEKQVCIPCRRKAEILLKEWEEKRKIKKL